MNVSYALQAGGDDSQDLYLQRMDQLEASLAARDKKHQRRAHQVLLECGQEIAAELMIATVIAIIWNTVPALTTYQSTQSACNASLVIECHL